MRASEGRGFESVDFGASALEEDEAHRLVAKANELMVVDSSPPYPLNGSAGPCLAPNMLRGQLIVPCRKAINGTIQSANKPP